MFKFYYSLNLQPCPLIEVKGADSDGRKRAPGTQINIVRIILYDQVL